MVILEKSRRDHKPVTVVYPGKFHWVCRGGSRNEERGGTLLLAGDSVHSVPSMGSVGMKFWPSEMDSKALSQKFWSTSKNGPGA